MTALLNRSQAIDHLRRGFPVLHNGKEIEPIQRVDGKYATPPDLPTEDPGTGVMPEFVPTRNPDGTLTRAGMEWVIRNNGSIMLPGPDGFPITKIEDLPADVDLAAGDVAQLERVKAAQDAELDRIAAARKATDAALAKARADAAARAIEPPVAPLPQAPAAPPGFLNEAPRMGARPAAGSSTEKSDVPSSGDVPSAKPVGRPSPPKN